MEDQEGIDRLFLELASESRLDILRELQTKGLKMRELARRLDLTATEAFRQLKRLTEASLVQRQPEGSYTIAPYGKLVLQLSSSLEFVFKHREYFSTHDLSRLPYAFVNRIGELSQAKLSMETMENISKGEQMIGQAEQYMWAMVEGPSNELMTPTVAEQSRRGVKYRFLVPERLLPAGSGPPGTAQDFEARGLSDIPAIIALTEKEAGVFFRFIGGRADYAGFLAKDPSSLNWTKDLFLYYWDKGKRSPQASHL